MYEYFQLPKNVIVLISADILNFIRGTPIHSICAAKHNNEGIMIVPVKGIAIRLAGMLFSVTLLKKYNENGMTANEAIADDLAMFMK